MIVPAPAASGNGLLLQQQLGAARAPTRRALPPAAHPAPPPRPQWAPAAAASSLKLDAPNALQLLGLRLVVWRDAAGAWRCFEDLCPHRRARASGLRPARRRRGGGGAEGGGLRAPARKRAPQQAARPPTRPGLTRPVAPGRLAPLSEGRIHEGGDLQCAYHGCERPARRGAPLRPQPQARAPRRARAARPRRPVPNARAAGTFDKSGACSSIPQIGDAKAQATACGSGRACVKAYPVQVLHGVLWVLADPSPAGWAAAAANGGTPECACPELLSGEFAEKDKWFQRDVPLSYDVLLENFLDPAHVPQSHHGVLGDRNVDQRVAVAAKKPLARGGFSMALTNSASSYEYSLIAPFLVRYNFSKDVTMLLYGAPTAVGWSRVTMTFVGPKGAPPGAPLAAACGRGHGRGGCASLGAHAPAHPSDQRPSPRADSKVRRMPTPQLGPGVNFIIDALNSTTVLQVCAARGRSLRARALRGAASSCQKRRPSPAPAPAPAPAPPRARSTSSTATPSSTATHTSCTTRCGGAVRGRGWG